MSLGLGIARALGLLYPNDVYGYVRTWSTITTKPKT